MSRRTETVHIDGAQGEGGGQVLRSSLTLSLLTGRPLHIERIRAGRRKPGLQRQHLTAVRAAAEVGNARVIGGDPGSQSLSFQPQGLRAGRFQFAIGTAGSCTLVLQTILPALLLAPGPSRVLLSGGTHNPQAPPADFLRRVFLPLLNRIGGQSTLRLLRHGFYPAGGGEIEVTVEPAAQLRPLELSERGALLEQRAQALIAALPMHIAERELATVARTLGWSQEQLRLEGLPNDRGPGNALMLTLVHEGVTEMFTSFGEVGVRAEQVAAKACRLVSRYLASGAAAGPFLADQLLLPLALAGGSFTTVRPTQHTLTNLRVIEQFLPHRFEIRGNAGDRYRIRVLWKR